MPKTLPKDAVDIIVEQWKKERPDLDASVMGPMGRLSRNVVHIRQKLDDVFAQFGLSQWEFDVLATLRRSGKPYCLAPTDLFLSMMITSGTMTHRLKLLESREFIQRLPNKDDGRSMLVKLTKKGLQLVDKAVEAHIENEQTMLNVLTPAQIQELDHLLALLLASFENNTIQ